jgi:hypothetical protein
MSTRLVNIDGRSMHRFAIDYYTRALTCARNTASKNSINDCLFSAKASDIALPLMAASLDVSSLSLSLS